MYSPKLFELTSKHPEWREIVEGLVGTLEAGKEYSFRYLTERFPSVPPQTLSLVLTELVSYGFLNRIVRVESPETGGGIGDFGSLLDVPDEIVDFRTEKTIEVTPDILVTLFTVLPKAA